MKKATDKDFEDFRDSYSPEQDVITPIMKIGECDNYVYAIAEYMSSLGVLKEDPRDQNGGEIVSIEGDKDATCVVYSIDFYDDETCVATNYRFKACGNLIKDDDNCILFKIRNVEII